MASWFKPKVNTGEIIPEIETLLQGFEYKGLTDPNDPVNRIAVDIMRDDFNEVLFGSPYLNVYRFTVNGVSFYCCDRAVRSGVETRRHMCLLTTGKPFPFGFELTTNMDDEFINNDCDVVEVIGNCLVRVENTDQYEGAKSALKSFLRHLERFSTASNPISFFYFPEDPILGYHVSGRLLNPDEFDSAVTALMSFG